MSDVPAPDLPSSWSAEDPDTGSGRGRVLWVVGAVVGVLAVLGIGFLVLNGAEEKREWPPEVGGRPAGLGQTDETADEVTPTAAAGIYVWNDFDGWHLWQVAGDGSSGVSGTITSTDGVTKAELSALGVGSVATADGVISFELPGDAALSGVDFEPGFFAEELTIDIDGPDGPIDPSVVTLGRDTPAESVPIVIPKPVTG